MPDPSRSAPLEPAPSPGDILRWIAEESREMMAAVGPDLRYLGFNRAYQDEVRRVFGMSVEVGTDVHELLARRPDQRLAIESAWRRALAGEELTVLRRFRDVPAGGIVFEVSFAPLRDDSGSVIGAALVGRDVTAREEARAEVERLAAELERRVVERTTELAATVERLEDSNVAKTRFLSVISHELRTPLTAIVGYTDLLAAGVWGELVPRQREQVARIHAATWHVVSIIDEILVFARTEEGRERVHLEEADVIRIAHESTDMLRPQADAKKIALRNVHPAPPLTARTDPGKLRQILVNLVGNAVKFTDAGEVVLEVVAEADALVFRVRDTGPGIPEHRLADIFEPFTQVDMSSTRTRGGTGLGLTVSRRLARLLGGEVTVQSEPGQGSTFTVTLPRQR